MGCKHRIGTSELSTADSLVRQAVSVPLSWCFVSCYANYSHWTSYAFGLEKLIAIYHYLRLVNYVILLVIFIHLFYAYLYVLSL